MVSIDGGTEPLWSPDGREVYFLNAKAMMAVPAGSALRSSAPVRLFDHEFGRAVPGRRFAVRADGRFIVVSHGYVQPREIRLVTNWFEDLKAKVPIPGR